MHLNHLDLAVPDVAAAASFFESAFGFAVLETRGRDGMAILRGAGFALVLTRDLEAAYPKTFHIGFLQPDEQAVLDAYARIQTAGFDVPRPPAILRGSLMFYCTAPGGILVEVSHRPESD
jgi:catechol 2,3-dioxygenase-like lactoylglutathione lyase family enzyme